MRKKYACRLGPKYIVRKGDGPVWGLWRGKDGSVCMGGPGAWLDDMLACLEVGRKKWGLVWRAYRTRGRVHIVARAQRLEAFAAFADWLGRVDGGARTLQEVRGFRRLVH
jgi:hypothetical protein